MRRGTGGRPSNKLEIEQEPILAGGGDSNTFLNETYLDDNWGISTGGLSFG